MLEVLLAHPGGPFWARRDVGAWTIPKGEIEEGEDALRAARREFTEETGYSPSGTFIDLGTVTQKSGKVVKAWAVEGNFDPRTLKSLSFEMEWPPRSGKRQTFPEIDRAQWCTLGAARGKILAHQLPFLDRLSSLFSNSAELKNKGAT
jgi:predicted NUDIX family NTP pyrophosphohydrolase